MYMGNLLQDLSFTNVHRVTHERRLPHVSLLQIEGPDFQLPERVCLPFLALLRHLPENCKRNVAVQATATAKFQHFSQEHQPVQTSKAFSLGSIFESYGSRCLPLPYHLLWFLKAKLATQRHQLKIREPCPIALLALSHWNLSPCLLYPW